MRKAPLSLSLSLPLLLALAGPALGYTVKSNVECPDLLREDANEKFAMANKWWIMGYITGRNFENDSQAGKDLDGDVIYGMALQFCADNPDGDIDDAAKFIFDALR